MISDLIAGRPRIQRIYFLSSSYSFLCYLAMPTPRIVIETSTGSLWVDVLLIGSSSSRPRLFVFFSLDMHAHFRWRSGHSLNTRRVYRHEILEETNRLGSVSPWLWCRPALADALPMAHWLAPAADLHRLPPVLRYSTRQEMTKNKSKKSAPKSEYRRASIGNSTTPKMAKETVSLIEELAEKDSKRKKKKDARKTEDGIVRRLAKNGLIDKDKAKQSSHKKNSSQKKKKKKKGSSSSSSSYCDSFASSADASSDSDDSSGDGKKKKSKKNKSRKDDNNDKTSAKAKSKVRKENKIQKLTQSMEDVQKGMFNIATELRESRGLPSGGDSNAVRRAASSKRWGLEG